MKICAKIVLYFIYTKHFRYFFMLFYVYKPQNGASSIGAPNGRFSSTPLFAGFVVM